MIIEAADLGPYELGLILDCYAANNGLSALLEVVASTVRDYGDECGIGWNSAHEHTLERAREDIRAIAKKVKEIK